MNDADRRRALDLTFEDTHEQWLGKLLQKQIRKRARPYVPFDGRQRPCTIHDFMQRPVLPFDDGCPAQYSDAAGHYQSRLVDIQPGLKRPSLYECTGFTRALQFRMAAIKTKIRFRLPPWTTSQSMRRLDRLHAIALGCIANVRTVFPGAR